MANLFDGNDLSIVKQLKAELKALKKDFNTLVNAIKKAQTAMNSQSKSQKQAANSTKKLSAVDRELLKIERQLERAQAQLTDKVKKAQIALLRQKEAVRQSNIELRRQAGIVRRGGGLFRSMTKSILAAGAAFFGLRAAFNVVKNGVSTVANFEQGMSKVRAVTNAVQTEFKALSDNAKLLGKTTSKSAVQVSKLQLEFAKLGFSTKEILNATEATIQLSIAAGSDLAESATVAASTVRGFGLTAKDTQKVVDVMAKSFASSSLDLEKFKTIMATVAPIAKASGKDIEFVTSRVSVLTDAGIDASTAGTSLRNMFLELSKSGLTWDEGLAKINNSTNKNATALQLFGKRGATAALVLADNIDKANKLEVAYRDSAGAAKRMATIMEDNLIGDSTKLSSAWEGLILTLTSGGNSFTKFLRGAVQGVTNLVGAFQMLVQASPVKEIAAEREEVIKLTGAVQNNLLSEEDRLLALEKLKLLAPEVAKGVTLEAESYETLNEQLDLYLEKAVQRIAIASLEEKESKAIAKAANQRIKQADALSRAFEVLTGVNDEYRISEGSLQDQLEGTITTLNKRVEAQLATGEAISGAGLEFMTEEQKQLGALNLAYANLTTAKEKESSITQNSVNPITQRIALLKEEFGLTEKVKESVEEESNAIIAAEKTKTKAKVDSIKKQGEILRKADQERFAVEKAEREAIEEELANIDTFWNQESINIKKEQEEEYSEFLSEERDKRLKEALEKAKEEAEEEAEIKKTRKELETAAEEAAGEIAANFNKARIDNELAEYMSANEAKQEILKKRLDKGQISEATYQKQLEKLNKEARIKEAKAEKKKALWDIAIATAVGIAKAGGNPAKILTVVILNALQAAIVAAKPIPKFKHGTKGKLKADTLATVSEEGSELGVMGDGRMFLTPPQQTNMVLEKGTEIFPHHSEETKAVMGGSIDNQLLKLMVTEQSKTTKAIEKIPIIINKNGYTDIIKNGSTSRLYRRLK